MIECATLSPTLSKPKVLERLPTARKDLRKRKAYYEEQRRLCAEWYSHYRNWRPERCHIYQNLVVTIAAIDRRLKGSLEPLPSTVRELRAKRDYCWKQLFDHMKRNRRSRKRWSASDEEFIRRTENTLDAIDARLRGIEKYRRGFQAARN